MYIEGIDRAGYTCWLPERVHQSALLVLKQITRQFNNECREKRGGYLCVADLLGHPLLILLLGEVPEEKVPKYLALSIEKARRLADNGAHLSSWQSRDGVEKWGGAIKIGRYILSFSGLPEMLDETLVLQLHRTITSLEPGFKESENHRTNMTFLCNRVAEISSNEYWARVIEI